MPIIGTAGHVDHGKSTLVQALTGRDPDRWAEEKERGLTIDLGFAWTELAPERMVGFVDVPGHERFMKNMLAGVGAIDVALFVVGADEGWMPQTEEHLAVLDLIDVGHGVIALTRSDLVDADTLELAELEIGENIEGTTLEGWPIVAVSPVANTGLEELKVALLDQLTAAGPPPDVGRPRLWVDRSFVITGAGVVVTGTLTGGEIHRGDTLAVYPGAHEVRIRGLQSHERDIETAVPGTRTAINLAGIDRDLIERGSLLAGPNQERTTRRVLADVRTVRSFDDRLTDRGAFHIHMGSGAWPARLRPVGTAQIEHSGPALIDIGADLPAAMGDRFILREVGRRAVVAGGRVLDPSPAGRMSRIAHRVPRLRAAVDRTADEMAQALLDSRGNAQLSDLRIDSHGGTPTIGLFSDTSAVTEEAANRLATSLEQAIRAFQADNPLRAGAPKASLASRLGVAPDLLDLVLQSTRGLVDDGVTVRTDDFTGSLGPAHDELWQQASEQLAAAGAAAPRASRLGLGTELLHALVRAGRLIQITPDLVYLPAQVNDIVSRLSNLSDDFTVADFRDELQISRRQAVPLLEWLDSGGYTQRRGDVRIVRKRPGPESSSARLR